MIVPGEASESDENDDAVITAASAAAVTGGNVSRSSSGGTLVVGGDESGLVRAIELDDHIPILMPPSSSRPPPHQLAHQLSATVNSVTEAVGKQWGNISRQSTFDFGSSSLASSSSSENYTGRSLLHHKLLEKNAAVKNGVERFAEDNLGGAHRQVRNMLDGSRATKARLQETVLCLQQCGHFSAEAIEAAGICVEVARTKSGLPK